MKKRANQNRLDQLLQTVRRRLLLRRLLARSSRNLLAALVLLVPAAAVLFAWSAPQIAGPAAVLCLAAIAAALAESLLAAPKDFDAAVFIDRRLGLHERLSSYVLFARGPAPAGDYARRMAAALHDDAAGHAREISAAEVCPVLLPRTAPFTATALFCVVALILSTASDGSAKSQTVSGELDAMLNAPVAVNVNLPPDLQEALDKIKKNDPLEAAAQRLDDLLDQYKTLDALKKSLPNAQQFGPKQLKKRLAEQPDLRERLQALLDRLGEQKDASLQESIEKARRALQGGSEEELAAALKQVIGDLTARTAKHDFAKLQELHEKLNPKSSRPLHEGVTRSVEAGGNPEGTSAAVTADFPEDAVLEAEGAVESGQIPPRYRWAVERYFQNETPQQDARDR